MSMPWIKAMVIRLQYELLNTKRIILPVGDRFITRTKRKDREGRRLTFLRNGTACILVYFSVQWVKDKIKCSF